MNTSGIVGRREFATEKASANKSDSLSSAAHTFAEILVQVRQDTQAVAPQSQTQQSTADAKESVADPAESLSTPAATADPASLGPRPQWSTTQADAPPAKSDLPLEHKQGGSTKKMAESGAADVRKGTPKGEEAKADTVPEPETSVGISSTQAPIPQAVPTFLAPGKGLQEGIAPPAAESSNAATAVTTPNITGKAAPIVKPVHATNPDKPQASAEPAKSVSGDAPSPTSDPVASDPSVRSTSPATPPHVLPSEGPSFAHAASPASSIPSLEPSKISPGHLPAPSHELTLQPVESLTPNRLEVRVSGGALGWVNVRADLDQDGNVRASLRGPEATTSVLRAHVGELNTFLAGQSVSLAHLSVETARPSTLIMNSPSASNAMQSSDSDEGQGQRKRNEYPEGSQRANANASTAPTREEQILSVPLGAAALPGTPLANTGGWLSVRV